MIWENVCGYCVVNKMHALDAIKAIAFGLFKPTAYDFFILLKL